MDLLCLPEIHLQLFGFLSGQSCPAFAGYIKRNGQLAALAAACWGDTLPVQTMAAVPDLSDRPWPL